MKLLLISMLIGLLAMTVMAEVVVDEVNEKEEVEKVEVEEEEEDGPPAEAPPAPETRFFMEGASIQPFWGMQQSVYTGYGWCCSFIMFLWSIGSKIRDRIVDVFLNASAPYI